MGIKLDQKTKTYTVSYSKRHPITRQPVTLKRVGIKSKAEAKRKHSELVILVEKRLERSVVPDWETNVKSYIQDFGNRDVSQRTVENYWLCLRSHTFADWGKKLITEITAQDIRNLIQERGKDKSESHKKNLLKYIRGALNFAVEKGDLLSNPTPQMKFRIGDKLKAVLTVEQAGQLLTQAKIIGSEWYEIWATALYTGMRNGELYALTWDKVNLERRQIVVDCAWNNKDGFKDTKSGDDRIVEIAPDLLVIFKELHLKRAESNFVLPRLDKWDRGEQARELRMFLAGLSLPRIRFHDLRATWATIMLSQGIAPIKVMAMGGWKDLKTMQHYIRLAGVNLTGITDDLTLHNPMMETAQVLEIFS